MISPDLRMHCPLLPYATSNHPRQRTSRGTWRSPRHPGGGDGYLPLCSMGFQPGLAKMA